MSAAAGAAWLVDEGSPGHRAQSEGVLAALAADGLPLDVRRIVCAERLRGVFRPAARALFSRLGDGPAQALAHVTSRFAAPDGPAPALVIGSAGRAAFAIRALALGSGAPGVFVGNPKPIPAGWFDAVLSPIPLANAPGAILTGVVPSPVSPEWCRAQAEAYWGGPPPGGLWAALVGGNSRNHRFSPEDFAAIGRGLSAQAAAHGARLLVTTSRRTGAEGEAALEAALDPSVVAELSLYGRAPRKVVGAWLGAAEAVFVTQDSLTMLSEALASGRRTVCVAPAAVDLDPENFMARLLRAFDAMPQFSRVQAADLGAVSLGPTPAEPYREAAEMMRDAARALRARLAL